MAVIPAFGSFAATPNTAQSYLSGAKLAIDQQSDQQRLAAQVQQHAQTIALEKQRLQQQAQLAEIEMAAKQAAQQREELVRQQQNEIENQYKQSMIGLKQRELEQDQQKLTLAATQAARQFSAKQKYESLIAGGMEPQKAILQVGPEMGIPGGAYTAALGAERNFTPTEIDVGGNKLTQMSPNRYAFSPKANLPNSYEQGPSGYFKFNNRLYPEKESLEDKQRRADLKEFTKDNASMMQYITGDKVPISEGIKQKLPALRDEYQKLQATLPKSLTPASTNRIGRFNVISDAAVSR